MTPLTELKQIERVSIHSPYTVYYYLLGWKGCRFCEHIIKYEGKNCPTCGRTLSNKPRTSDGRKRLLELLADPIKRLAYIALVEKRKAEKSCSRCQSKDCRNYCMRASGRYPIWFRDGNGGYLCKPCYDKSKK